MRAAFFKSLLDLAGADDRIWLLVADSGPNTLRQRGIVSPAAERFRERHPERFTRLAGGGETVAGVACGLALSGRTVFVYGAIDSIGVAALERVYAAGRARNASLKLIAGDGGVGEGSLARHHSFAADVALLRSFPDVAVTLPSGAAQAATLTRLFARRPGIDYMRLGSGAGFPGRRGQAVELGRAVTLLEGTELTLIATGAMVDPAIRVAKVVGRLGVSTRVLDMHTVSPVDREAVLAAATETRAIVTLEEHSVVGGLGSAVAEVVAESSLATPVVRLGIPLVAPATAAGREVLLDSFGLSVTRILETVNPIVRQIRAADSSG